MSNQFTPVRGRVGGKGDREEMGRERRGGSRRGLRWEWKGKERGGLSLTWSWASSEVMVTYIKAFLAMSISVAIQFDVYH